MGLAIALSGALYLGLEYLTDNEGLLIGDLYAILFAVFLSPDFLLVEQLRNRFSATTILLWRCAVGRVLFCPSFSSKANSFCPPPPRSASLSWAWALLAKDWDSAS